MKRWYVTIGLALAGFTLLCVIWVNLAAASGVAGALRRLGKGEAAYQEARRNILLGTGTAAPAIMDLLGRKDVKPRAKTQALRILADLAVHEKIVASPAVFNPLIGGASREVAVEALRALATIPCLGCLPAIMAQCRGDTDTAVIRAGTIAIMAAVGPLSGELNRAIERSDTVLRDSLLNVAATIPALSGCYEKPDSSAGKTDPLKARGFITSWWMVGSFNTPHAEGWEHDFGPESEPFDPARTYEAGDGTTIRWTRVALTGGSLLVDLNNLFTARYSAIAYARTRLIVPAARRGILVCNVTDGLRVWVNGVPVYGNRAFRGIDDQGDVIPVSLQAGENTILIKLSQDHAGEWRMGARITELDSGPMKDVVCSLDSKTP